MRSLKKNEILIIIFSIFLFLLGSCQNKQSKTGNQESTDALTYSNPIIDKYLADPCIMFNDGYYYLFATGSAEDGRFIPIHRTLDFVNWEFVRGAVNRGAETDWNYKHFWAPEVIKLNNKWHLYYTASPKESPHNSGNRVGLAISDSIQGPYEDYGVVIPHASIDGHVYVDGDSTMYIFYTIEHLNLDGLKAGQIYLDILVTPTEVMSSPRPIITHHTWQEGPFLQYRYGKYFLTYSCGAWTNDTYHVRYAISEAPRGPYIEQPDTILKSNKMVKGPGHHFMYKDKNEKDWIVYHGWDTAFTARYPRIDRIYFDEGKISSDGPTYTTQKLNR